MVTTPALPWGCNATYYNGVRGGPIITTTLDAAVRTYLNIDDAEERARIEVTSTQPIQLPEWPKALSTFEADELEQLGESLPASMR